MLATINPEHVAETISTLKFADRVKQIRNKAQINKEITGEEVTKLQQQIKALVLELEEKNKIITEIQPTDNLQFQLQQEFQNVKEILMSIHQLDLNQIESQCDAFNERKSIITQLLRNLNFPISFGNDILGQMEVESKLQCEIIQKDELIYKLQKKLRELEQKNYDQQNFYKIIQQQQQRNYEEQLKHKEDMIFQLKDDIDTSEISKYTLQRQLDELNLKFNQFNQESMCKQGDILVEEQLIRDQENTIKDLQSQIEQMCARFESLKLQFTQVQETVIYKEEQVVEISKMNQNQRDQLEVLHEKIKSLQKLSEFERLFEQERILHNQLKQKYQEFENKALNTSEQQFIQIQQLQAQIESYECHEDTLEQENLIYRETIRQLEIQMEQISQSQNRVKNQFGLKGDDVLGDLVRRTEIVQKSKMKHQNECLLIKQQNQIQLQNLNMRMKRVQDLEAQNMELLQENDQLKLQLESGAGEQQIIIMNLESKINELKIDVGKLRQAKIQLQSENNQLCLLKQDCDRFLNYMLAKLREYTQNTYRRNRALTAQQQQYFLQATAANATPFSEIQNYVEMILLDNPDKSVAQSQYRRSIC